MCNFGTPQVLTDENGQIAWYGDYEPFGKVSILVERTTNNFRFPGQYFIEETGLYYNWWRWYEGKVGRYIEVDIFLLKEKYAYSDNNLIINIDFYGTCSDIYTNPCPPRELAGCPIGFVRICKLKYERKDLILPVYDYSGYRECIRFECPSKLGICLCMRAEKGFFGWKRYCEITCRKSNNCEEFSYEYEAIIGDIEIRRLERPVVHCILVSSLDKVRV